MQSEAMSTEDDFKKEVDRRLRQHDRAEDTYLERLSAEMTDPGSTGCDPEDGPPTWLKPDDPFS